MATCPSCLHKFRLDELRAHLHECLTAKLHQYRTSAQRIQVKPMDPSEYRDFHVAEVRDETVVFHKQSNMQDVEVPLRAIREITPPVNGEPALITLRGGMRWKEDIQRWRYAAE